MNNNSKVDFSVDKEAGTITVKREFAAPPELIWDAYTNSEILDRWWAPKPWQARTKSMDFREGGQWLYAMVGPAGEEHWAIANYTAIEPGKRFTGIDAFTDAEGNVNAEMPQSKWDVTLTGQGQSTLVQIVISYDDLAQLEATIAMGFREGLLTAMEGLDALLPSMQK